MSEERFELVDAHVHLWDLAHRWYPAMQEPAPGESFESLGDVTRMARDFLPEQYRAETGSYDIVGLVHVSATTAPRAYVQETGWVDGVLDEIGVPAALIGAIEPGLSRAEIEADLDAQAAASPRLRGVRVLSGLDPESAWAVELCELLAERGLLLDLVAHPGDAAPLQALLERFAELPIVLEHAGWPDGSSSERRAIWRDAQSRFAAHGNISCKVSGLGMVTHSLAAAELRPWIETCLEVFGPERCMFGGNFPVDAMYGRFDELIDSVRAATGELSEQQRRAFFVENARRCYGL